MLVNSKDLSADRAAPGLYDHCECPVSAYVSRVPREAWCAGLLPLLGLGTWRGLVVLLDILRTMQLCFPN